MTVFYPFSPAVNQNYAFQPTLDGSQYNAVVTWSMFGQRWVLNISTLRGVFVMQKPLTGSPPNYDVNLIEGYFNTSKLVFRQSTNNFEVSP